MYKLALVILFFIVDSFCDTNYSAINLPDEHMPYYYFNFPNEAEKCLKDKNCPYKEQAKNREKCWGYESNCKWENQYSKPECPGDHKGWVSSKKDQEKTFHRQADFGYIKQRLDEMSVLCEPTFIDDSSLECTRHMRYCRGRNLMLNFTNLANRQDPIRYQMNVLDIGDIAGFCDPSYEYLRTEADHLSALQSWGPEMRYFDRRYERPIIVGHCDVVIEKPTYIMKIDATVNMYHHFCDFFNLYASLHLNTFRPDAFSTDVNVLIWETYTYRSAFQDTWEAFTDHPVWDLKSFRGETVCFKNAIFPLLPRMIFGLYYNTPIIYGCEKSGLFDAFSKHVLHRLRIPLNARVDKKIRVTFLSRNTKYRKVLNENALLDAIKSNPNYEVQRVVYDKYMPFKKQLRITRNSDVFIGIHGAGLTHLMFLPEWATLFELYNCEDPNCYFDLARLKGVRYITWRNTDKLKSVDDETYDGGAHAKFANYYFDVEEFVALVEEAVDHVRNHTKFQEFVAHLEPEAKNNKKEEEYDKHEKSIPKNDAEKEVDNEEIDAQKHDEL